MDQITRLEIFVEVVKANSFIGAARALGVTSSAVSKQIQALEDELKVQLLHRTTRKITLSEAGERFYPYAAQIMTDLSEAKQIAYDLTKTPKGRLKINCPHSFGLKYLTAPLTQFAALYPDIEMDIQFDDRFIDVVAEGYDVVIRIADLMDSTLKARKLDSCPLLLLASPEYLKKHGTPQTPQDLDNHNMIIYNRHGGASEWRYQARDGSVGAVALKGRLSSSNGIMNAEAAIAGLGIALSPYPLVKHMIDDGQLVPILSDYQTYPQRHIYAVFPPGRHMSHKLRAFLDFFADWFKHHEGGF